MLKKLDELSVSAWALLAAGVVVSLVILAIGENPIAVGRALIDGAFGGPRRVANTLQYAIPLTLSGLAVALAFRGGLFNIGVEGQLYVGAFAAAIVASPVASRTAGEGLATACGPLAILAAILAGVTAGAFWAGIAGALKSLRGVNEVIATIMLNWIALFLVGYLVNLPSFKATGDIPQTAEIAAGGRLPGLFPLSGDGAVMAGSGLLLALTTLLAVVWLFGRSVLGYEIRAVGHNPSAAEAAGIPVRGRLLQTMLLSGAIAGLVGADQVLGVHHRFIANFSPGFGYLGIAIALLGRNHPVGIVIAAFLFAALKGGALQMDALTNVPREMITVLQAVLLLFVAAAAGVRARMGARET
ncbi:MAG: ABC transporter permease [Planctomycetes bacterium]|nr:ABC transporter permease [Planctomycetota bacterium]